MLDPCVRLDPCGEALGQGCGCGAEGLLQNKRGGAELRALLLAVGVDGARMGMAVRPLMKPFA
eukprot:764697-Lingulodinium_polyedra.AAC.1